MTLIFEIAVGLVLGVAIIAIIVAFWHVVLAALIGLAALAVMAGGIAILYSVCGSWGAVAVGVLAFGTICAAKHLIDLFNDHERYGPSFRAIGDAIAVGAIFSTFASVLLLMIAAESVDVYLLIFIAIGAFTLSFWVSYRNALKREISTTPNEST